MGSSFLGVGEFHTMKKWALFKINIWELVMLNVGMNENHLLAEIKTLNIFQHQCLGKRSNKISRVLPLDEFHQDM